MKRARTYTNIADILIILFISIFWGFLFFSCDAASGFLLDVNDELKIETIVPGAILKNGDEVPINLEFNESLISPDYLEVQFLSEDGESHGKFELEYRFRSNASFPTPVVADSLEPGEYTLKLLIKDGTTILQEREIAFFLIDHDVRILSVNTIPSQVKPGSDVMLSVNLSGEASGYFVRWKFKDRILKEDLLENGGDKVIFKAPNLEGIYVVKVEIFPGKVDPLVNSSLYSNGEILVTEDPLNDDYELTKEERFTLLYHFAGDLKNSAEEFESRGGISSEGRFVPMQKEGNFGYLFNKESRLVAPFNSFPVNAEGVVESFAVCGQIAPTRVSERSTLFSMEDGKGDTSLKIEYNGKGRLTAIFSENGQKSALSLPLRADDKLSWIVLSVAFSDDHVTLSWYIDAKLISSSIFSANPSIANPGGFSVLGDPDGEDKSEVGFVGFIGSWGVYKSINPTGAETNGYGDISELLNRIVHLIYRERLIYHNSFDSPIDGRNISLKQGPTNKGNSQIQDGYLLLFPGASLSMPPFSPKEGTTRISVDTGTGNSELMLRFWPADAVGIENQLYYETALVPEEVINVEIVVDQLGKTIIFQSKGAEKEKRAFQTTPVVCTIEHRDHDGEAVNLDTFMVVYE